MSIRIIRLVVISFVFFFLLATAFSLMIPSHVRISKAINIKGDKDSIMARISHAERWREWYPGMDSVQLFYEEGKIKGVVINQKDASKPAYMIITKTEADEVDAQFNGRKLKPVMNVWKTIKYPTTDSITVQWYMDFHLRWYPWEKFASLLLEKSYAPVMENGLKNLKKEVEN